MQVRAFLDDGEAVKTSTVLWNSEHSVFRLK